MVTSELRIGNWVLTTVEKSNWKERYDSGNTIPAKTWKEKVPTQVDSIYEHYIDIYTDWGDHTIRGESNFEPILITREVADTMTPFISDGHWYGNDNETDEECYFYNHDPLTLKFYGNALQTVFYGQEELPVKYLHQLQNLYYALTGRELTVTFPTHATAPTT